MSRSRSGERYRSITTALLIALLAACISAPLVLHGPSCGHDYGFHMQSWMDAAAQIRHGHLLPHWAYSPAFNAGEPRFVFYPPLSWLLGSLLLLTLPGAAVSTVFTWIALTAAGLSMYALASVHIDREAALLAAAVYIGNPYMLFTVFERTAYAELLAAAWLPLLFRAALARRVSVLSAAVPLALLWLTNAPAAVMGTYAFVVLILCRLVLAWRARSSATQLSTEAVRPLLAQAAGGLALGLALPGFYLLPAAWERRYVQIAMVIIPNMRVEDNFLFGHTGYGPHDQVLHTASDIALLVLALSALALAAAWLFRSGRKPDVCERGALTGTEAHTAPGLIAITALAGIIAAMLWQPTLPLWHILPELAFLQFPWRLLAVLGCIFGLAAGIAFQHLPLRPLWVALLALGLVAGATGLALPNFRQGCEVQELLPARIALFQAHHGVGPTDEYTPTDADNDQLRWDDPAWWLAAAPNTPGPHTVPNPAATIVDYDQPPPLNQTVSGRAPMHVELHLNRPEDLILNLRDYPAWRVTLNGHSVAKHLARDDGLLALALPAGDDTIDIRWHTLADVWAGDGLSVCALAIAAWLGWRSRRIEA